MTSDFPAIGTVHCITLEGSDARRFAQAQFSGNVAALRPGHWQWNACLDARGRVLALMHLVASGEDRLLAVLRGGDAEILRASLARYVFRLRVTIAIESFSAHRGEPLPAGTARQENGVIVLGYGTRSLRLGTFAESASPDPDVQRHWRLEDIRRGWPILPGDAPEFLPPALGLERLGAVAFDKGCYPGQEIVARLHYRGGHKWHLCRLRGPAPLPVGEVREAAGSTLAWVLDNVPAGDCFEALAVLRAEVTSQISLLGNVYAVESTFDA
jgi:folate-binding protein YgfZ